MVKRSYYVKALWDAEAKTYYSQSDILGLHIETPDLDLFEEILFDSAMDLIVANHITPSLQAY